MGVSSEALRDEERPDDFEPFGLLNDREVFVEELDVSAVFPVELDFDDDADFFLREEEDRVGLSMPPVVEVFVPRLDEERPIRKCQIAMATKSAKSALMIFDATFFAPSRLTTKTTADPHVAYRLAYPAPCRFQRFAPSPAAREPCGLHWPGQCIGCCAAQRRDFAEQVLRGR